MVVTRYLQWKSARKSNQIFIGVVLHLQEEDEGSEDDSNTKPDFTVTLKTDFSARCFLDQFEDDADGFISPMDDKIPSKCSQDTGLSNLHAASMYVCHFDGGVEMCWWEYHF